MKEIKTRNSVKDIKVLDKSVNLAARMRNAYVRTKETANETQNPHNATPTEYATDNIQNTSRSTVNKTIGHFRNPQKKVHQNIHRAKRHFQEFKRQLSPVKSTGKIAKSTIRSFKDISKSTIKTAKNTVKTARQTAKTVQKTAQAAAKSAKAAEKSARASAKASAQAIKVAIKAIISTAKAAIAAVKGIGALIIAGGWVAVAIILIICMIALLLGSAYGIFFSGEPSHGTDMTLKSVIAEIDEEYTNTIDNIINDNAHDILDVSETQADWQQVLAVYTVKTATDPDNPMEVFTMDNEKAAILRTTFWDMNNITHTLENVEEREEVLDADGLPTGETGTVIKTVLYITVVHKTFDEISAQYCFTDEQKEWLEELLKPEYDDLWIAILSDIISVDNDSSD